MSKVVLEGGEALAKVGDLEICYQTFGRPSDPPLLLIMGLGAQMIVWEDDFCAALAARGFWVVRFDNRDVGKSTKIDWTPPADPGKAVATRKPGEKIPAPYLLKDMAEDAVGLMDVLGIASAHVVGASMGGMIAQELAIRWPERVRSLTSIMSTTGDPRLPPPSPEVMKVFTAPPPRTPEEYVEANVGAWRIFRGPGYPEDEKRDRARALRAAARGFNPEGTQRQLLAVYASGSRKKTLPSIVAPTLVIHGADDPLAPLAAGEDTAASIPGARLVVLPHMGHSLPVAVWPRIIDEIAAIAGI
ncbi:MAG: alpha/beta hydrolase [Roseiarcus sp.]|jgi:pimeloyl-ACP methyl ester carboxylesterase